MATPVTPGPACRHENGVRTCREWDSPTIWLYCVDCSQIVSIYTPPLVEVTAAA